MKRRNHAITLLLLLITVLSAVLAGCTNERHTEPVPPETASNVSVVVAQTTTAPDWLETVGSVRAAQTSQVSSQMMGNILEIRVHEGDRVQSGQILATVDDSQPRSRVEQAAGAVSAAEKEVSAADSELALADSTLKRYQQLYDNRSVSPQEFDEVKARRQSAEARREMAQAGLVQANAALAQGRTSLGYAQIRAPFAGVITEKKSDPGTLASPGMPIFKIEDTRRYRLETTIDESDIHIAHLGQVVVVAIDSLGNADLSGKVVEIVPAADAASRSFLVKVELPSDTRLRSGLFGRARFPRGERTSLSIPRSAVVERGQLQGVYVVGENQIAGLRYITLGKRVKDQVEVLSGLQPGEKLVTAPGDRELGGKRMTPQR